MTRSTARRILSALLLGLCIGGTAADGGLEWKGTDQTLELRPGQREAVVHFSAQNSGLGPVRILSVVPSCPCTVVSVEKPSLGPGDTAEIVAVFHPLSADGSARRVTLAVRTDEPLRKEQQLSFTASAPWVARLTPSVVAWKRGEPRSPKLIQVAVNSRVRLNGLVANSNDPRLRTEVKEEPNGGYLLTLTPDSRDGTIAAIVDLTLNIEGEPPGDLKAFAVVE